MKIQLTEEQIAIIAKNEKDSLLKQFEVNKKKLEDKLVTDIRKLEKRLEDDISKIANKHKFITIDNPVLAKRKSAIDPEVIRKMVEDKKTVKEMAAFFNCTENSVRNKLHRLKIRLT